MTWGRGKGAGSPHLVMQQSPPLCACIPAAQCAAAVGPDGCLKIEIVIARGVAHALQLVAKSYAYWVGSKHALQFVLYSTTDTHALGSRGLQIQ